MKYPFSRAGTPNRPSVVAVVGGGRVELRRHRSKGSGLCVAVEVLKFGHSGSEWLMVDSAVPLAVLLRGLGITLDDCRTALEDADAIAP